MAIGHLPLWIRSAQIFGRISRLITLRARLLKLRILTSSSKLLPVDPPAPPEQFPESTEIIVFSRVAFDRTNKKALVYVGRICGPLGYLILLTESQGARKVEDKYLLGFPSEVERFG